MHWIKVNSDYERIASCAGHTHPTSTLHVSPSEDIPHLADKLLYYPPSETDIQQPHCLSVFLSMP